MTTHNDIIAIIERMAPPCRQESYDNTGWQCGDPDALCSGALICVDITGDIIAEARELGCNLVITHHPLLFHATKCITPRDRVHRCLAAALRHDIAVYSCHTAIDNTVDRGVSAVCAQRLGLTGIQPLVPGPATGTGAGAVGDLPEPLTPAALVALVKRTFGSPVTRCSHVPDGLTHVSRVALCGGAGAEFIADAYAAGATAYITSDCKHNHFLDLTDRVFLIDIGHYESEECTKDIFYKAISEKMPNFALYKSRAEKNPINYM